MKKKNIAIIGAGMMGGSLGLAIRRRRLPYHVVGIGRKISRLKNALRRGACHQVTTNYAEGLKNADVAVICTTVGEIVPIVRKIKPFIKPGTAVTDIGSVKSTVLDGISRIPDASSIAFIGGHPLAGSEKTGVEHSHPDLYRNAVVVLCSLSHSEQSPAFKKVRKLWRDVGARTVTMSADIHDILVAQTSHLPHILAGALVQLLSGLQRRDANTAGLLAGSFRDLTRIVDSDSRQWSEISSANHRFVIGAMKSYQDILRRLILKMEASKNRLDEWNSFFSEARINRNRLLHKK